MEWPGVTLTLRSAQPHRRSPVITRFACNCRFTQSPVIQNIRAQNNSWRIYIRKRLISLDSALKAEHSQKCSCSRMIFFSPQISRNDTYCRFLFSLLLLLEVKKTQNKTGATQTETGDLRYVVIKLCTHVAPARVQTINRTVRENVHMCMTSIAMTFIQRCNSALGACVSSSCGEFWNNPIQLCGKLKTVWFTRFTMWAVALRFCLHASTWLLFARDTLGRRFNY